MNPYIELVFSRQLILNLLTLPIPVMLMVQVLFRKNRTPEINIFLRMCIFNTVLCLTYLAACYYMLNRDGMNEDLMRLTEVVLCFLMETMPLLLTVCWLLFVEYTLHRSRDIIRRRYPVVMIPFCFGLLIAIARTIEPVFKSVPMSVQQVLFVLGKLEFIIWSFYILSSYVVLYYEKKRKKIPQYIRLTPTVVSILAGLIIAGLTSWLADALGYAIGLMFADYFMFRRLSYIDTGTGFFNEKYLAVINNEAEKQSIHDATVISFKTQGEKEKPAKILRFWKPEHSVIVAKDDGGFLVISGRLKKNVTERFILLVREHCEREGIEAEASYEMVRR